MRIESENRRSLHSATPNFLLSLVALANFMRLSLTKAAHAATSSDAWQEIRVRSGRDDKSVELRKAVHRLEEPQFTQNKFVISTGAYPDFLSRGSPNFHVCGFLAKKAA
jgi:hypothetical protein